MFLFASDHSEVVYVRIQKFGKVCRVPDSDFPGGLLTVCTVAQLCMGWEFMEQLRVKCIAVTGLSSNVGVRQDSAYEVVSDLHE